MAERQAGVDPAELRKAYDVYANASSSEALDKAIETNEVLRSPDFHAALREEYLGQGRSSEAFTARYDQFFYLLHQWAYVRTLPVAAEQTAPGSAPWLPPYFAALRDAVRDAVPEFGGPWFNPATDGDAIARELASLGINATLTAYAPHPGWLGIAISVMCIRCTHRWLQIKPYAVDLALAPEVEAQLRTGTYPEIACPRCGNAVVLPFRPWVMEMPGSGDALFALSCIWRRGSAIVFTPPPGTVRDEQFEPMLEIRFACLLRHMPWPEPARDARMAIAYSIEELTRYLAALP